MPTAHHFQADHLRALTHRIFTAVDTPDHIAAVVAEILVNANLTGHDSHGVLRIPAYLNQIQKGNLDPAAEPEVIKETANTLLIDAQQGFGHYTSYQAMTLAIEKARQAAVCCVSFKNTTHIGRLGEYAEMAARAGCIGFITTGGGRRDGGGVVPFGGARGALGTNPMAVGVPTGDDVPYVLDFATSIVAEGKLQVARSKNVDVPEGYIVDKAGNPSTKTADFYEGGYLLPVGGHKGYALSLMICLLGGLNGTFNPENGMMQGQFMQVINVAAFTPLETYQQHVRAFLDGIKTIPPAPGFEAVIAPGDLEHRTRAKRLIEGIDLPAAIYEQLQEAAKRLNVSFPLEG